jgi:carbon-monoxide dehydrogenase large subunit
MIERLMDAAARQTGIDRTELRRRNMIRPEQMPYTNAMDKTYDSGGFANVMARALELADWKGFAGRAAASKSRAMLRGQGIATFIEWTGVDIFAEVIDVMVTGDGLIEIFTAAQPMGQSLATTLRSSRRPASPPTGSGCSVTGSGDRLQAGSRSCSRRIGGKPHPAHFSA